VQIEPTLCRRGGARLGVGEIRTVGVGQESDDPFTKRDTVSTPPR